MSSGIWPTNHDKRYGEKLLSNISICVTLPSVTYKKFLITARLALHKCIDAFEAGGSIIVSELMMDDDKTGPLADAMMSLCMLIDTEGRNYTWSEYTAWLEEVGFTDVRRISIHSPGANGLVVGRKP